MAFASPVAAQSSLPSSEGGWAGGHLGIQLGMPISSSLTFDSAPGIESELDGMSGGVQIGFRRQTNAFVYGGEAAFLVSEPVIEQMGAPDVDVRVTTTRLGAQAGYDLGRFLPYGTLGVARMTFQDTVGFGDTSSFGTFAGLGVEYQLGESTSVGLQAVRENFENFNEGADINVTQTNVSVQFNIRY
ncbi:outer membrane protein [Jannaschia sp. CCS1]|uniref:outer membrane protein n=1 Tax=Jannaschia sp. (strain CCS1) TaxID=290400 RepID=UPI0020C7CE51|nr:outer membrane beta-barrel protein [Jannaschia sp. CCS1]